MVVGQNRDAAILEVRHEQYLFINNNNDKNLFINERTLYCVTVHKSHILRKSIAPKLKHIAVIVQSIITNN